MNPIAFLLLISTAQATSFDDLESLADAALRNAPSLEALRASEQALRERADVAGSWPDPMIGVEYSNAPVSTGWIADHPMAGVQFKAQQMLKPVSWSSLNREVASFGVQGAEHATAEAELALRAAVADGWWRLARARMLRSVTERHIDRTEEVLTSVRSRYEVGAAGQHAVLRLEVLRDRLKDDLSEFDKSDQVVVAALRQALALDDTLEVNVPSEVIALAPPASADWEALAMQHRPELQRIVTRREMAENAATLARINGRVSPSIWAGYRVRIVETETDPGVDLASIGVSVPIPTGSGRRADGNAAAALQQAQAAAATLDAALDGIDGEMERVLAHWHRAYDKSQTYAATLIPGAEATLKTTQSDFAVGRADFASLFEAEVTLLQLERAWIVAATETHLQLVAALKVLGTAPEEPR